MILIFVVDHTFEFLGFLHGPHNGGGIFFPIKIHKLINMVQRCVTKCSLKTVPSNSVPYVLIIQRVIMTLSPNFLRVSLRF